MELIASVVMFVIVAGLLAVGLVPGRGRGVWRCVTGMPVRGCDVARGEGSS